LPKSYDITALRRWAAASKIKVPRRGRIPKSVVERFLAQGWGWRTRAERRGHDQLASLV